MDFAHEYRTLDQSTINRSLFEFVKSVIEIQQMVKINSFRDAILSNDVFKWNMPASELIFHGNLIWNKDWECWKWPPSAAQKKNSVCCPIPPLKPFKFGSKHLFSCSGIASGLCAGLALFQKNHLFCLLFHFIFRTPPHPPPHLRTEQPCRK